MIRTATHGSALLAITVLAACGGGSHSQIAPAVPTAKSTAAAVVSTAKFSLLIPNGPVTNAKSRAPQYVSASTLSAKLRVDAFAPVDVELASNSPACTNVAGGRSCILTMPAPVGSDSFSVTLYSGANWSGTALSAASNFNATIAEGSANATLPLVLGGVVASVAVSVVQPTAYDFTTPSGQVILTVRDASGNIIIAPGSYVDSSGNAAPIQLSTFNVNPNYGLTVNGGANASAVNVNSPADVVQFNQSAARAGTELVYSPAAGVPGGIVAVAPAYAVTDTDTAAAPLETLPGPLQGAIPSGTISGIDDGSARLFTYDGTVLLQCNQSSGTTDAASGGSGLFFDIINGFASAQSPYFVLSFTGCVAGGLALYPTATTLTSPGSGVGYIVIPGTLSSACIVVAEPANTEWTVSGSSCINPHDIVWDPFSTYFAFAFTSSGGDEIAIFNGLNDPGTHQIVALPAGAISGVAIWNENVYVTTKAGLLITIPNLNLLEANSVPLPAEAPASCTGSTAQRQFVVGDNGDGFLALGGVSCANKGLLELNLSTAATVRLLPTSADTASVARDGYGLVYYDSGTSLKHYPSAAAH